jgi:hypothetical protein
VSKTFSSPQQSSKKGTFNRTFPEANSQQELSDHRFSPETSVEEPELKPKERQLFAGAGAGSGSGYAKSYKMLQKS